MHIAYMRNSFFIHSNHALKKFLHEKYIRFCYAFILPISGYLKWVDAFAKKVLNLFSFSLKKMVIE